MKEDKHIDTRILRTYELLTEAFFRLADTKSIDSIRISEICDAAMVHRATFYNHFNDKDDFINFVIASTLKKTYDKSLKEAETDDSRSFGEILLYNLISFAELHRSLVLDTTAGNGGLVHDRLYDFFLDQLASKVVPNIENLENKQQFESAFCHYIAGGSLSLIRWWLSGGYDYSTKENLVERIKLVLNTLLAVDR
ncbi:MAG: TetR/AcrR family transcriptional regulator [Clostridia bacterium]|nr:TetR/AcrR family transcriptional regulator [Clostridia bacterium]